jgi:hypothetical protein
MNLALPPLVPANAGIQIEWRADTKFDAKPLIGGTS